MANLLQITTPIAPKGYDFSNKSLQTQSDQVFNIDDPTKVTRTTEQAEEYTEQNLSDDEGKTLPDINPAIAKNPGMTAALLKMLIGTVSIDLFSMSEDTELLNKVTEFANEVMLKPEEAASDMVKQEKEVTLFSGDLWETLKSILSEAGSMPGGANPQLINELVSAGVITKKDAAEATVSQPFTAAEITTAIKQISEGSNLSELTESVIDFMKATVNASSRDDILNSVATNLRFLAHEVAPSRELAEGLISAADNLDVSTFSELKAPILALLNYTEQSLILSDHTKNLIPLTVYNMSRFSDNPEAVKESFDQIINMTSANPELSEKLTEQFVKYIENSNLPPDIKLATLKNSDTTMAQRSMTLLAERVGVALNEGLKQVAPEKLSRLISTVDTEKGNEAVKEMISPILPKNLGGALNTMLRSFESTKDLNQLIDRLGTVINSIDNLDKKITLAQGINEVLTKLAEKTDTHYRPPTSMDNMVDFLAKNINDPALKSLSSLDKGEMVQGLLTAPSASTPLLHYLIPINMDGFKAFGELWADPNEEKKSSKGESGGETGQHMFLCFDVENVGYFELEVYAYQDNLNILLLCPSGTENTFHSLKETLPVIAGASGYKISNAAIGSIQKRRDLPQVFSKLNQKRGGLNVKI